MQLFDNGNGNEITFETIEFWVHLIVLYLLQCQSFWWNSLRIGPKVYFKQILYLSILYDNSALSSQYVLVIIWQDLGIQNLITDLFPLNDVFMVPVYLQLENSAYLCIQLTSYRNNGK